MAAPSCEAIPVETQPDKSDLCILCNDPLSNGRQCTTVTSKRGLAGLQRASRERGISSAQFYIGQVLHKKCRSDHLNSKYIARDKEANSQQNSAPGRRSTKIKFDYRNNCILCGTSVEKDRRAEEKSYGKKTVFPVRSFAFQSALETACLQRNDDWSHEVQGRIEFINDLHAADAVYHQQCNVNFRTGNGIPRAYSQGFREESKLGRPTESSKTAAFEKVIAYVKENDEEQVTMKQLCELMGQYCDDPYTERHLREKLTETLGDDIIITSLRAKVNTVTYREKVEKILDQFAKSTRENDQKKEKLRIVETAARLVLSDIKEMKSTKEEYPSKDDISDLGNNLNYLTPALLLFLETLFHNRKDASLATASIGQAIMSVVRPKSLLPPLQIGLAVELHHLYGSRYLVEHLNQMAFCSTYAEVKLFEQCAAATQGTDLSGVTPESHVTFVADNVDHNVRTIDGAGTFHGMGIIGTATPGKKETRKILRDTNMTAKNVMRLVGEIPQRFYNTSSIDLSLKYQELQDFKVDDPTRKLDLLWKISWPLRSPRPGWSGFMQAVSTGDYPGRTEVTFLPMIDLDPSNLSCIYSTLHFVCDMARRYKVTPVITFDQPLWWKAQTIIDSEPDESPLRSMVLCLGGFHTQMSFLGSIGHLMSGSGLQQLMEVVVTPNTALQVLSGKSVKRAVRVNILVDAVLNALLSSSALGLNLPDVSHVEQNASKTHHEGASIHGSPETSEQTTEEHTSERTSQLDTNQLALASDAWTSEHAPDMDTDWSKQDKEISECMSDLVTGERGQVNGTGQGTQRAEVNEQISDQFHVNTGEDIVKVVSCCVKLFDSLLEKAISPAEVASNKELDIIDNKLCELKNQLATKSRTSCLWLQYMNTVEILKTFIKAERTGDWALHLQAMKEMLPYMAAAGHNLYAKSIHIYLQQMQSLGHHKPDVFQAFQKGFHVLRISDRYWAGLSQDLVIEQVLMRSLKTAGGLTRGRGMGESQRTQWLLSMPACADVNEAMQTVTSSNYTTSDQHIENTEPRQKRDDKDMQSLLSFLIPRNPFSCDESLRNISTGATADKHVNADKAKEVGEAILEKIKNTKVQDISFKKKDQVVTMSTKPSAKVTGPQVDPQMLFQRLVAAAQAQSALDLPGFFTYDLSCPPAALFDACGLMREAAKSQLVDALVSEATRQGSQPSVDISDSPVYVIDGGSLLHKIPWKKGDPFASIAATYVEYITRKYSNAHEVVVIFDGYDSGPSTKDAAHARRSNGIVGPSINFAPNMLFTSRKEQFLANNRNKQCFITFLGELLEARNVSVLHASEDADTLIVDASVKYSSSHTTIVLGEDTDLFVLLLVHAKTDGKPILLRSDIKGKKHPEQNILYLKERIGDTRCRQLPFLHAVNGCDTTSRLFGIGKGVPLKKVVTSTTLECAAETFSTAGQTQEAIIAAGEKAIVCLYNGQDKDTLDFLRYKRFSEKVASSMTAVAVQSLPPSSGAAKYHSLRVYLQVQRWLDFGCDLQPEEWGWQRSAQRLEPKTTDLGPAPSLLMKGIRCKCKTDCGKGSRCTCRTLGLECTLACADCKGLACSNAPPAEMFQEDPASF